MQFPASDEEKQIVHQNIAELVESLAKSANLASDLVALLNENFLAINQEYRKEIIAGAAKIDTCLWHLNLQIYNMSKNKERIIGKPE